jgi:uncharacterized membrane protein YGL010W
MLERWLRVMEHRMRKIDNLFNRYGESHRNPTNKAIHWICVPLITWSLLAALWSWTPIAVYVLITLAVVFYTALSLPIAIGMLGVSGFMVLTLTVVTEHLLIVAIVVFAAAWIGQFIGHKIEGKKPSFFEDIKFLLIGPAWLLGFVYQRLGITY